MIRSAPANLWRYLATKKKSVSAIKLDNAAMVTDTLEIAGRLNNYFQSVYAQEIGDISNFLYTPPVPELADCHMSRVENNTAITREVT